MEWSVTLSDDEEEPFTDDEEDEFDDGSDAEEGTSRGDGDASSVSQGELPTSPSSMPSASSSSSLIVGVCAGAGATGAFEQAVADIIVTGYAKKDPVEALLMEMNCYKLAQNRAFEDCLNGTMAALIAIAMAAAAAPTTTTSLPPPPGGDGAAAAAAAGRDGGSAGVWSTSQVGKFLTVLKAQLAHWSFLLGKLTQVGFESLHDS